MTPQNHSTGKAPGFSLIELLVVIAILGILTAITMPALTSILRGSSLNRGGQLISDQLALARQEAVSKNRDIEVRFYYLTNGLSSGWRGIQLFRIEQTPTGTVTNASSRISVLPDQIEIRTNNGLSPLLTAGSAGTATLPAYGITPMKTFLLGANGSLKSLVGDDNYVTLVNSIDKGNPPANYYTIQIDPLTGKVSVFRP